MTDLFGAPSRGGGQARRSDLVDLELQVHAERPLALLVSHGDARRAVWLPKSQIEFERRGALAKVTLPEALAIEKGLV